MYMSVLCMFRPLLCLFYVCYQQIKIFKGTVHDFFKFREIFVSFGKYRFVKFRKNWEFLYSEISQLLRKKDRKNLIILCFVLNCLSHFKYRENICFRNFRNEAKFRETFDRNVSRNFDDSEILVQTLAVTHTRSL